MSRGYEHGLVRKPRPEIRHGLVAKRDYQPPQASGRPVVQGSDNPKDLRKSAAAQEDPLVAAIEKAVEGIKGVEVIGSRVKDANSQQNKADRDKPIETQKDHLGVRVTAETPEAQQKAVEAISKALPITGSEPLDNNGLQGTQLFVRTGSNGAANQVSEIQIVPKAQAEAMKETDGLYDQQKKALAKGDQDAADALSAKITARHEAAMQGVKSDKDGSSESKYKFGSTQANIPEDSDAHRAIKAMQGHIDDADLAGDGKDVDKPHVTVRYGLRGDLTPDLHRWISTQAPFQAKLGSTTSFPPSEHSDGAAPIIAPVESPDLHRMNKEIEGAADFEPSSFPTYKPHATVAYVKPEKAAKYSGMNDAQGKTFKVASIAVSDRNGNHTEIPLKGDLGESPERAKAGSTFGTSFDVKKKEPAPAITTGTRVRLSDGRQGVVKGISLRGDVEVKLDSGGRARAKRGDVQPMAQHGVKSEKVDTPIKGVTAGTPDHDEPSQGAVAVDLDKTLAEYDGYKGPDVIGKPIPAQVDAVKKMLANGDDVWIFTARANSPEAVAAIKTWAQKHIGQELPVTNIKWPQFAHFIDDRAELPVHMQEPELATR